MYSFFKAYGLCLLVGVLTPFCMIAFAPDRSPYTNLWNIFVLAVIFEAIPAFVGCLLGQVLVLFLRRFKIHILVYALPFVLLGMAYGLLVSKLLNFPILSVESATTVGLLAFGLAHYWFSRKIPSNY